MTKYNAHLITEKIADLSNKYKSTSRRIWPRFVFHFANISNIANILKANQLYSREMLKQLGSDFHDTASGEVLNNTAQKWKSYVRFYMRPNTPMLYNTEGIRPNIDQQVSQSVHCPIPVYLLFDSEALLTHAETRFSDGNLASSRTTVYTKSEDFVMLPFEDIYHLGPILDRKRDIIHRRHAEVVFPSRINLEYLRLLWCRSEAERETLKNILSQELWERWGSRVRYGPEHDLFNHRWVYVLSAKLKPDRFEVTFNSPHLSPTDCGPFSISVHIEDREKGKIYKGNAGTIYVGQGDVRDNILKRSYPGLGLLNHYKISLFLNNHLAYVGVFKADNELDDIPF